MGGIFTLGTLTLTNCTITDNHSDNDDSGDETGGGLSVGGGTATLNNTIVAGNDRGPETTTADDVGASVTSDSACDLIGDGTGLTGISDGDANGNRVGTASNPINPRLGPLADNGGPTQTHAITVLSPAFEAGANNVAATLSNDQRGTGFLRRLGEHVDICAFEALVIEGTCMTMPDPTNSSSNVLIVMGKASSDVIKVELRVDQLVAKINSTVCAPVALSEINRVIVFGFQGNDQITGLAVLPNKLVGGGGDDKLFGGDQADLLNGGVGIDNLSGGDGDAAVLGGDGNDVINGEAGNDVLEGGSGADLVRGGDDDDTLRGGDGRDTLQGEAGNDVLLGKADNDNLDGGSGRDLLIGGNGTDTLTGQGGDDILIGGTTAFSNDDDAISDIMAEWTSPRDAVTRRENLLGTGSGVRFNGDVFLKLGSDATVFNDRGAADALKGNNGRDWFFQFGGDLSNDFNATQDFKSIPSS